MYSLLYCLLFPDGISLRLSFINYTHTQRHRHMHARTHTHVRTHTHTRAGITPTRTHTHTNTHTRSGITPTRTHTPGNPHPLPCAHDESKHSVSMTAFYFASL